MNASWFLWLVLSEHRRERFRPRDMRICNFSCILWPVKHEIRYARRETCFTRDVGDGIVAAERKLRAFESHVFVS